MVGELRCLCLAAPYSYVQSKDKFLSAASSDGFGFCSVILWVTYISYKPCIL
jgi:hypothetical protein